MVGPRPINASVTDPELAVSRSGPTYEDGVSFRRGATRAWLINAEMNQIVWKGNVRPEPAWLPKPSLGYKGLERTRDKAR